MTCFSPTDAWHSKEVNPTGKRSLVFNPRKAQNPKDVLKVKCRGCIGCRMDKASTQALRIIHEKRQHEHSLFVTLTYRDDDLPMHGSVNKRHCQLFFKKLRKANPTENIRYDLVSEYGPNFTQRPHYHLAMFGHDPGDLEHTRGAGDFAEYESESLNEIWGNGDVHIGTLTEASAGYIGGYIFKKITGPMAEQHYLRPDPWTGELIQIQPEFRLASTRPAIGKTWFDKYGLQDIYIHGECPGATHRPIPEYYDKLLEKAHPEMYESLKARRKEAAIAAEKAGDTSWLRLMQREEHALYTKRQRDLRNGVNR